ncbi:MAG: hypothetical protein ABR910_01245 [Acidobacteriaceae bacterium]|jgi:uncharacterized membrane protein (UPF0136 family)
MIARLLALVAAIAALVIGFRIYNYSGSLDSSDLRINLALLAAAILVCFIALRLARKKNR